MKLILDGAEIDCLAWRASGNPNKQLNSLHWRFITRAGDVRLVTPLQIQYCGADGINPYAEKVEMRSTLWPVSKLIRDVSGTKDKGARLAHVDKFVRAVCGRWLVGFNHDGNISDWGWMGRQGAEPEALRQLIDCGELLKPAARDELTAWLAGLASKYDRMTHADSLTVLDEIRDRLEPHLLPESKKWRNDDPMDGTCPFIVPTKKWGSQNCSGYSTWDDFGDDEAGEDGFVNFYIVGWLNNPIRDRGLAVSGGYRTFLERHIDFEAIFQKVSGGVRHLPVDRIAEKPHAMTPEERKAYDGLIETEALTDREANTPPKPMQKPCPVCGWTHNEALTLWKDGESVIAKFRAVRNKEPTDAVRILRCLHTALKNGKEHVTAQELSDETKFNGEPSAAFKHQRSLGTYDKLVESSNNYRRLKRHPSKETA